VKLNGTDDNPALRDPDVRLMLRAKAGDETAFTQLVANYQDRLVGVLAHMLQNKEAAEDLAQEVFLRVYRSRETYEPTAKFTTWLFRIATHLALNWIRDHKKKERSQESLSDELLDGVERQVADRKVSIEQEMVQDVKLQEIRGAIGALPEKQRAAVLMHKYDGLDYGQIARSLGCSESAVKSLLFRAYETLRVRLAHMA
jgi:RNA polymerase sigma-70 factor (ECF subfamily)